MFLVCPDVADGVIDLPLRRDEQGREAYMRVCTADHPDAETARSGYRTLASANGAALMELDPETGRMHQLRVHLAALGRPIAGDRWRCTSGATTWPASAAGPPTSGTRANARSRICFCNIV